MKFSKSKKDPHSFAKPELARVIDIHLELNVDFERKVLKGKAILTIERKPLINKITLDNIGLVILRVTDIDGTRLKYHVKKRQVLGSPFSVRLPLAVDITSNSQYKIQIEYETSPYSPALYWLTPAQTADGRCPFLLSNNKLIYARAWFPCQDTPSVKFTCSAKILVPRKFKVIMSANLQGMSRLDGKRDVYEFSQKIPVPSYAVIIAAGSLRTIQLNRTIVFVENKYFDKCIDSFCFDTFETMLEIAEILCGPYVWNEYNICVLPQSIAHFKIECPCVTFISPTIICGDRSHISKYITRNISQSWAGNLVTCSNYEHLWLNRSFSTFIWMKIYCRILNHVDIKSYLERKELRDLNNMIQSPTNVGLIECLLPDLTDMLPHEATKHVPYKMGCMLLCHLENILGGPSVFEPFLKSYFLQFARKSINTNDWMFYLYQYFPDKKKILDGVAWDEWFHNVPSSFIVPDRTLWETKLLALAVGWSKLICGLNNDPSLEIVVMHKEKLCDLQATILLHHLHCFYKRLTKNKLRSILHRFTLHSKNREIWFLWLLLCVKVRWTDKVELALRFAIEFRSPNYACPIFQQLYEWEKTREIAIRTYKENKERMLYETRQKLDIILHLS